MHSNHNNSQPVPLGRRMLLQGVLLIAMVQMVVGLALGFHGDWFALALIPTGIVTAKWACDQLPDSPAQLPDSGYGAPTPAQQAEIRARALAFAEAHPTRARIQRTIAMSIGLTLFFGLPALALAAVFGLIH